MVYIFQATTVIGHILIVVWIYLVVVVRKKKTKIFRDQMEPKLAERRLKWLKTSLLVAGILYVVFIACLILQIVLDLIGKEEPVSFFIAVWAFRAFIIATIGSLVVFLIGRRKQAKGIPK